MTEREERGVLSIKILWPTSEMHEAYEEVFGIFVKKEEGKICRNLS
jgi:hypothetical protein